MGNGSAPGGTGAPRRFTVETVQPAGPGQHFATNPRAGGRAAGMELLFMGVNFVLQWIGGRLAENALQQQLNRLAPRVERDIEQDPNLGVLLRFHWRGGPSHPESLIEPVYRFGYVTYGRGHTISEARRHAERHGSVRSEGNWVATERWFRPTRPPSVAALRRPYLVIGRGTFVTGRARLQDVRYGALQGFDDEGLSTLATPARGNRYEFDILDPPGSVILAVGNSAGPVSIPIERRQPGSGAPIPVVSLDSILGSVAAAMIFPANDFTDRAFGRTRATIFEANISMRSEVNIARVRWARPEDIRRS